MKNMIRVLFVVFTVLIMVSSVMALPSEIKVKVVESYPSEFANDGGPEIPSKPIANVLLSASISVPRYFLKPESQRSGADGVAVFKIMLKPHHPKLNSAAITIKAVKGGYRVVKKEIIIDPNNVVVGKETDKDGNYLIGMGKGIGSSIDADKVTPKKI